VLSLVGSSEGDPVVPPALIADIAGGSYPAIINILLALLGRERTGEGVHLDIAMADNVFPFLYWAIGNGLAAGRWPVRGGDLVTGGSPRYNLYPTSDGEFVAAAPLEEHFWESFCDVLGLDADERDDGAEPDTVKGRVAARIAAHPARHWRAVFAERDCCCCLVRSVREAYEDAGFRTRGLFDRAVDTGSGMITALPLPLDPSLRRPECELGYPLLGADNGLLD
jgi:alpha-methylacyl-CoA racemase